MTQPLDRPQVEVEAWGLRAEVERRRKVADIEHIVNRGEPGNTTLRLHLYFNRGDV